MGCWNATCAVSQFSIKKNEKVRILFLVDNKKHRRGECFTMGVSYSNDLYSPFHFSIKGKYDEYGGIENEEKNVDYDLLISYFNKKLKSEFKSINEIIAHLYEYPNKQIGYVLVKENVYQSMIEMVPPASMPWINEKMNQIKSTFREKMDLKSIENKELKDLLKKMNSQSMWFLNLDKYFSMDSFKSVYANYLKENKLSEERLLYIKKDLMFLDLFDELRKVWTPQSGAGSQNMNTKLNKKFYKKMTEL